jgi:hypothetical protein
MLLPFQTWRPKYPCTAPSCITFVTAKHWRDWPYDTYPLGLPGNSSASCIERQSMSHHGSVEDPSNMWQDKRGRIHVLMHQSGNGGRAWSGDGGQSWQYNYSWESYPYDVELSDGGRIDCHSGREEPRVLLDPTTGLPSVLANLCKPGGGPGAGPGTTAPTAKFPHGEKQLWTRIVLQRINTDPSL